MPIRTNLAIEFIADNASSGTACPDTSANANNWSGSGGAIVAADLNGHDVVYLSPGSDLQSVSNGPTALEYTWFWVGKYVTLQSTGFAWNLGSSGTGVGLYQQSPDGINYNGVGGPTGMTADTGWHIYHGTRKAGVTRFYKDGVSQFSPSSTTMIAASGKFTLGRNGYNSQDADSKTEEFQYFDAPLSAGNQQDWLNHLRTRTGLTGSDLVTKFVDAIGNSLTAGYTDSAGYDWPTLMQAILGSTYTVRNQGHSGETIDDLDGRYPTEVLPHFDPGPAPLTANVAVVWEIVNQRTSAGDNISTCIAKFKAFCARLRGDGYFVIAVTTMSQTGGGPSTLWTNTDKAAANAAILDSAEIGVSWDSTYDLDTERPLIGLDNAPTNHPTYFNGDGVHLSDIGQQYFADGMAVKIAEVLSQGVITSVAVSPTAATLYGGQTVAITPTVSGTDMFDPSVNWSADLGSVDDSGVFTAPGGLASGSQTATITAASVQDPSQTADCIVTIPVHEHGASDILGTGLL